MKSFSKNKTIKKGIIIFGILLIIPLLLVMFNVRPNLFGVVKTNQLLYKENNTDEFEEEKLYNHAKDLSITLLDTQGRIVSSTNQEKEIASVYKYTDTKPPIKYLTVDETLLLLIEMNKFFAEEGNLLINNKTYYYLDIPSYIIPDNKAIVNNEEGQEIELFKSGKARAYGGIYEEGPTGYRFKIRFEEIEDITELSANFQFTLKLSNTIYNQVLDLKTLRMEDLNNLQFWVKKPTPEPPPEPEPYPYELTQYIETTSAADVFYVNTILKDKRPQSERKTKGKITINIGQDLGVSLDESVGFFKNIEIYVDGVKLDKNRNGNQSFRASNGNVQIDFKINSAYNDMYLGGPPQCDPANNSHYNTCLANSFDFTISNNSDNANIGEIRIELKEKMNTTKMGTYGNKAIYTDFTDTVDPIKATSQTNVESQFHQIISNIKDKKYDFDNNVASSFTYRVGLPSTQSNYLKFTIKDIATSTNGNKFTYYTNSGCFNTSHVYNCSGDNGPRLYIEGKRVYLNYGLYNLTNIAVPNYFANVDMQLQKQMKEVMGDDWNKYINNYDGYNAKHSYIWRSKEANEEGEYYYVVVSYDNFNYTLQNNNGRGDFSTYDPSSYPYIQTGAPDIIFWVFNTSNKKVEMEFDYKLANITRNADFTGGGTTIRLKSIIENNYTVSKPNIMNSAEAGDGASFNRYMIMRGEHLNYDIIKWEVLINTKELNLIYNSWYNAHFFIDIPYSQEWYTSGTYMYNPIKNEVDYSGDSENYSSLKYLGNLYIGQYNNSTSNCDLSNAFSFGSTSQINNKYKIIGNNNSKYFIQYSNYVKNNMYNDNLCMVYFTKKKNSWSSYTSEFQMTTSGGSQFSNTGTETIQINYAVEGAVHSTGGFKTEISNSFEEGKERIKWQYLDNSLMGNEKITYFTTSPSPFPASYNPLPYNKGAYYTPYYSGVYQFTDKIQGVMGKYTKLDNFMFYYGGPSGNGSISFTNSELQDIENKKCQGNVCVRIAYVIDTCTIPTNYVRQCLQSSYGSNYMDRISRMSNGISVRVSGLRDVATVTFTYDTITDHIEAREELLEAEDNNFLIDNYGFTMVNNIYKNDWKSDEFYKSNNNTAQVTTSATHRSKIMADISISKDVKKESTDKYLSEDTTKNTLTAQIGYSAVPELDINDIIKSIGNSSAGTVNDIEDIKELKKYLEIGNLSIKYYPGFSNSPITIYSNNSFINDWSNSTITFDPNDSNLYSLHLENLGKTIPMGSKFEVSYDLTFDIDNYRKIENTSTNPQGIRNNTLNKNIKPVYLNNIDNKANIKLLENEKNILDSYRNNDNYSGGYFYIITDAEAIREYTPGPAEEEVSSTNPKNYVDKENHKLHVFNNATVYGKHLKYPSHSKMISTNSNNKYYTEYTITTNFGSTGKEPKATTELNDELQYKITVPEELVGTESEDKINQLNELILANTKITNFEVYKQISDSIITLYKHEEMLEPGVYNFSKDEYSGTIILHGNDHPNYLEITATGFEYDEKIYIKYGTMVDFEKFYKDAIDSNLLDTNLKIKGTDLIYEPTSTNVVRDPVHVLEASASSGYINIKASMPTINKRVEYPNETDAKWTVNVTTGYLNEVLKITDLPDVQGSEAIKKSIVTKDLQIKVNDIVVYENDSFVGDWGQNIKIDNLNFEFKNTDSNDFISKNSNIEISYITHFDIDKYRINDGAKTDSYYINNEATLEKGYIKTRALATTKKLEFDYPLTISKTYIGNKDNDLEYTKWHYEVYSKELNRKNVIISDNSELSSDFGKYLSISDLSIKLVTADKEEEIYNHQANKNNLPQTIHITDIDGEELEFKKNGEYKFIIKLDNLDANTKVVVDYEFFIDREKYEYYEEPTDIELNINNNIKLDYDGETITTNDRGTSVISSPLSKKYRLINKTTTNIKMEWSIDINLDIDYPGELTDNDEVTIMDQLFGGTTYEEDSIKVYNLVLNGTSYGEDSLLTKDTDYTFVYEEDTVKVKLLHPNNNKNIRIIFNTNSETIPDSLKNYVSMSVNGKSTYISSNEVSGAFTTFIGGTVTSRGVTYFTIYANKYLDDKLTNKEFEFELEEVDYDGNELTEGIKLKAVNDENGRITFGPIKYNNDGIHYYKIKEKKGSERIEYDENVYTVKIKVVNFQNEYVIEESSIIGKGEDEEIEFYNKTIPPEPEPEPEPEKPTPEKPTEEKPTPEKSDPKNQEETSKEQPKDTISEQKDNPNTVDPIKIIFIILIILGIGILLIKKFKPTKYNQVS